MILGQIKVLTNVAQPVGMRVCAGEEEGCVSVCVYGFLLFFGTESTVLRKPFM